MISEYDIATTVISVIKDGLKLLEMEKTWGVIQGAQSVVHSLERPTLVLTSLYRNRYGWQHSKDVIQNGNFLHKEFIYQIVGFQLSAFKIDRNNQLSAMDAASNIAMYLNSEMAVRSLQSKGYGINKISEIRGGIWIDETDRYEISPNFDFEISLRQELVSYEEPATAITGLIKGV